MFVETKKEGEVVKTENWREFLLAAARVIEIRGWVQGTLYSEKGVCIYGAFNVAHHGHETFGAYNSIEGIYPQAQKAMFDYLHLQRPADLTGWNDHPDRTKEQVVSALREAAAK
jgi:hypothetical protein